MKAINSPPPLPAAEQQSPLSEPVSRFDMSAAGEKIRDEFRRLVSLGHSPARSAALIVLGAQREKHRVALGGGCVDASWQSTVAWLSECTKHTDIGQAFARACYHSMGIASTLDSHITVCAKEVRRITKDIQALGRHRRELVIVSTMLHPRKVDHIMFPSDTLVVQTDAEGGVIPTAGPVVKFSFPRPGIVASKVISAVFLNRFLRNHAPWPNLALISSFFEEISGFLASNQEISEVVVLHTHANVETANTTAEFISDLWRLPYFGSPGRDALAYELLYLGAKRYLSR